MIGNNDGGLSQEEEERRCEQVAQLLLEGMKGEELAKAVRDLDRVREEESSNSRLHHHHPPTSATTNLAMPIPMASYHNPFGLGGGFGYSSSTSGGLSLPPSAYIRRPSSVPLPLHNSSSDFFSFDDFSHHQQQLQALDLSAITLPSVPFITRPSSPINNISRQHHPHHPQQHLHQQQYHQQQQQQRNLLGQRRASSAQPVFRRSWTLPPNPITTTSFGTGNNEFGGFDWTRPQQVQRDESPLPDVDPELFNGFSFDHHQHPSTAVEESSLFSSLPSSTPSSTISDRNSHSPPWLGSTAAAHTHSRSHSQQQQQHLAIAPHDLPPLHVDMNWHPTPTNPTSSSSLTTTTTTSSSSSASSAFPSPSPPLPPSTTGNTGGNTKELEVTPTNEMFELSLGYEMGMDIHAVSGVDYGYTGYGDLGYGVVGDLGGLEMGYGMGVNGQQGQHGQGQSELGMWNVVGGQAQQA